MKTLYGNEAEIIVEEILKHGRDTASCILLRSVKRLSNVDSDKDEAIKIQR